MIEIWARKCFTASVLYKIRIVICISYTLEISIRIYSCVRKGISSNMFYILEYLLIRLLNKITLEYFDYNISHLFYLKVPEKSPCFRPFPSKWRCSLKRTTFTFLIDIQRAYGAYFTEKQHTSFKRGEL